MPDREKVITGIQYCLEGNCNVNCPYLTGKSPCPNAMLRDALALLMEQEARILSLGEAIEGKNGLEIDPWVFVELKGREDIFIGSVNDASHYNYPDSSFGVRKFFQINRNFPASKIYPYTDYMKTVRCWTHKPSEEQRKAVKWDE